MFLSVLLEEIFAIVKNILEIKITTSWWINYQSLKCNLIGVAKMVSYSLVGSRLDYANLVLFGTSAKNLARLHRIQSILAFVVTMQQGRISISKTLSDLHWPLMKFRVDFKVATLTFKVLDSEEPGYLYSRISIVSSRRTLRSSADTRKLSMIPSRTKIEARAFRHLAPQVWKYTTGHLQRFIRTIVQVKIKNSLLQTGLQLTELDLHCICDSASRWHCTWCMLCNINGCNNHNNKRGIVWQICKKLDATTNVAERYYPRNCFYSWHAILCLFSPFGRNNYFLQMTKYYFYYVHM